jgi:hypothetical protein
LLFLPDALATNLGHRAGCRLHLVSPAASEPISPAVAARGDDLAGWGCLGVRHGPPAFRLRAHMSMAAARRLVPWWLWVGVEKDRDREQRVQLAGFWAL